MHKIAFAEVPIGQKFIENVYSYIWEILNEDPHNPEYDYLWETKTEEERIDIQEDGFGSYAEYRIINNTGDCYIYPDECVYIA